MSKYNSSLFSCSRPSSRSSTCSKSSTKSASKLSDNARSIIVDSIDENNKGLKEIDEVFRKQMKYDYPEYRFLNSCCSTAVMSITNEYPDDVSETENINTHKRTVEALIDSPLSITAANTQKNKQFSTEKSHVVSQFRLHINVL